MGLSQTCAQKHTFPFTCWERSILVIIKNMDVLLYTLSMKFSKAYLKAIPINFNKFILVFTIL